MAEVSRHQREPVLDRGGGDPAVLVSNPFPATIEIRGEVCCSELNRPVHRQPLNGRDELSLETAPERFGIVTTHCAISEFEQGHLAGKGRTLIHPLHRRHHASIRGFPDQFAEHIRVEEIHGSGIGERI